MVLLHLEECIEAAEGGGKGCRRNKGRRCSVDLDAEKRDHGEEMVNGHEMERNRHRNPKNRQKQREREREIDRKGKTRKKQRHRE